MRITLVACLTAVILLTPAAAGAEPVRHTHSSSRFDRSPASLARELSRFDRSRADIVTLTEVAAADRARVVRRAPGFRAYLAAGTDTAVLWRPTWRLLRAASWRLAAGQRAGAVVLETPAGARVLLTVAHLPSHVQYGARWRSSVPVRVETWRAGVRRWAQRVDRARARWRPDLVMVVADWNVDTRQPVWRRRVLEAFGALRLTWRRPLPAAGTHAGGRLIDATLTNGRGRARLAADDPSSDHRPYRETLSPHGS